MKDYEYGMNYTLNSFLYTKIHSHILELIGMATNVQLWHQSINFIITKHHEQVL